MPLLLLDTNILVSSLWNVSGIEAEVMRRVTEAEFGICVSPPIMEEYSTVLYRPRLRFDPPQVRELLKLISIEAKTVAPRVRIAVSPDESDNRFLECAEAAHADFLGTGNKRHFAARWKNTEIVNARKLLAKVPK